MRRGIISRSGVTVLCGVAVLFVVTLPLRAQTRTWAEGKFELTAETTWSNTVLAPGTYRFRVVSTSTFGAVVSVERDGKIKTFTGPREWVRGGKGLYPRSRLLIHQDPEFGREVAQMELRGPNLRLKFKCKHKKKKGADAPEQATVLLLPD